MTTVLSNPRRHILIVIIGISAGTGTVCKLLGRGLRRFFGHQWKVSLLTFRNDAKLPENAVEFDDTFTLDAQLSHNWRQMLQLPRAVLRLRRAVREIRPDVVLSIGMFSNIAAAVAVGHVPLVTSDHLNLTQRLAARGLRWLSPLLRPIYRRHAAIGVSQAVVDDLQQNFAATRAVTILNGVDSEQIRADAQQPPQVNLPQRYVVCVGRLDPQKDIATLIRAHADAKSRGLAEHLVVVGDGAERQMLEELTHTLGTTDVVHFVGHRANPFPYMSRARMLVMSSVYEGFGLVLAEAMALGVPCVSTDCPSGPAEALGGGEFGILVPMRDPAKLADAMLRLANDESAHAHFATKAAQRAEQLSMENMTRQYRDLFATELQRASQGGMMQP